jgi:hypothetical protein
VALTEEGRLLNVVIVYGAIVAEIPTTAIQIGNIEKSR